MNGNDAFRLWMECNYEITEYEHMEVEVEIQATVSAEGNAGSWGCGQYPGYRVFWTRVLRFLLIRTELRDFLTAALIGDWEHVDWRKGRLAYTCTRVCLLNKHFIIQATHILYGTALVMLPSISLRKHQRHKLNIYMLANLLLPTIVMNCDLETRLKTL